MIDLSVEVIALQPVRRRRAGGTSRSLRSSTKSPAAAAPFRLEHMRKNATMAGRRRAVAGRPIRDRSMKKFIIALVCVFTGAMAQDAFAAITFKRFPHCPEGPVTVKPASAMRAIHVFGIIVIRDIIAVMTAAARNNPEMSSGCG
jgi:hypothetical protein